MIRKYLSKYPYCLAVMLSVTYIVFGIFYTISWYSQDRSTIITGAIFSLLGIVCLITTVKFHRSIREISGLPKLRSLFSHPILISGISLLAGILVCICLRYLISINHTIHSPFESMVLLAIIIADLTALIYSLCSLDYYGNIVVVNHASD